MATDALDTSNSLNITSIQNQISDNHQNLATTLALQPWQNEVIRHLQNRDFGTAVSVITKILEECKQSQDKELNEPIMVFLYFIRGMASFAFKEYVLVAMDLGGLIAKKYENRVINYHYAVARFFKGFSANAIERLDLALQPSAESFSLRALPKNWKDCLETAFTLDIHNADILKFKAQALVALGQKKLALNTYKIALAHECTRKQSQRQQAEIYFSMASLRDDIADTCEDYDQAFQLDPKNPKFYTMEYAHYLGLAGNHAAAYSIYTDLLSVEKSDDKKIKLLKARADIAFKLAISCQRQKEHETAVKFFTEYLQVNSKHALSYKHRAESNLALDEFKNARKDMLAAIEIEPELEAKNEDFYIALGDKFYKNFFHKEAADIFEKILHFPSNKAEIYYRIGRAKHGQGFYIDAIAAFDNALILKEQYAKAYYRRGLAKRAILVEWSLLNNDEIKYTDAEVATVINDFNLAIKYDERLAEAYIQRAQYCKYTRLGNDLDKALEFKPNSIETLYNLRKFDQAFNLATQKKRLSARTRILLAQMYQNGFGVNKNLQMAATYYKQVIYTSLNHPMLKLEARVLFSMLKADPAFKYSLQMKNDLATNKVSEEQEAKWARVKAICRTTFWVKLQYESPPVIKRSKTLDINKNQILDKAEKSKDKTIPKLTKSSTCELGKNQQDQIFLIEKRMQSTETPEQEHETKRLVI